MDQVRHQWTDVGNAMSFHPATIPKDSGGKKYWCREVYMNYWCWGCLISWWILLELDLLDLLWFPGDWFWTIWITGDWWHFGAWQGGRRCNLTAITSARTTLTVITLVFSGSTIYITEWYRLHSIRSWLYRNAGNIAWWHSDGVSDRKYMIHDVVLFYVSTFHAVPRKHRSPVATCSSEYLINQRVCAQSACRQPDFSL
jgi:hypothetical protein